MRENEQIRWSHATNFGSWLKEEWEAGGTRRKVRSLWQDLKKRDRYKITEVQLAKGDAIYDISFRDDICSGADLEFNRTGRSLIVPVEGGAREQRVRKCT